MANPLHATPLHTTPLRTTRLRTNSLYTWLLIILSGILYALPFWFPETCWPLVFLYLVPIMYVLFTTNVSFFKGYVWGFVAVTGHLAGVLQGIYTLGEGTFLPRLTPVLTLASFEALFGGIAFLIGSHLLQKLHLHTPQQRALGWLCVLWAHQLWMENFCLWAFDRCEGYIMFSPIIPLAHQPTKIALLLTHIPWSLLTLMLMSFSATIAYWLAYKNHAIPLDSALLMLPWIISWLAAPKCMQQSSATLEPALLGPTWLAKSVVITTPFHAQADCSRSMQHIAKHCNDILSINPKTTYFFFPESCVYGHKVWQPQFLTEVGQEKLHHPVHLFVGGFRSDIPCYRNCIRWIYNGRLQAFFDKRHAMPLVERIPSLFDISCVRTAYFNDVPEINPSSNARPLWRVSDELSFVPYVCSELFFFNKPDDPYAHTMITAFCHDLWTASPYMHKLMFLTARLKAILWQRDILYVAYHYHMLLTKDGHAFPVATEQPCQHYHLSKHDIILNLCAEKPALNNESSE